jgi:hypothetical protein
MHIVLLTLRIITAAATFVALAAFSAEPSNNDMVHYRDETNGYAIWYPKNWSKVPASHAKTKLKIVSKGGAGADDFNVVVASDPSFKQITADKLVSMILEKPEALRAQLRREYPDAKIIKSGKTQLDNQTAYYVIFDATFRSFELEVPMRFLQVSTVHGSRAYYLTSRTAPEEFDSMRPIFTVIMGGFRFLDR